MRTAFSPILISSRCTTHLSRATTARTNNLVFPPARARPTRSTTAGFATSPDRRRWNLGDLHRISEENSPLIFHLTSDNPYHNLSIEHYILTNSHPSSRILLFYTNRPCVVIGRNQNPWLETDIKRLEAGLERERETPSRSGAGGEADREKEAKEARGVPIDLIRRRSGGGTVFHDDGNLNYSVIVPNSKAFKRSTHAEMVVRALTPLSHKYGFNEVKVNDRNDIVMKSKDNSSLQWLKVSGSAYKLTKGRALHHGTLLFSSPNLTKISDLLRSPGRNLIQAKGVESVRSKVGNLAWTPDPVARRAVKDTITEAIVREFWTAYGDGRERERDHNEVYLADEDCCAETTNTPALAAGVAELNTDAWLFEQTPRFDFSSGPVDGSAVSFQVNHGTIVRLTIDHRGETLVLEGDALRSASAYRRNAHAHASLLAVDDWHAFLATCVKQTSSSSSSSSSTGHEVSLPTSLVAKVEAIFPTRQQKRKSET